ncbi:MAG: hypothetical protein DRP47_02660 [Candidatus Zixiibacteriota bacterium]|nr:MAG: hypothetical protein DRP47_02660 [candidate division Zixibacteria bacterium]
MNNQSISKILIILFALFVCSGAVLGQRTMTIVEAIDSSLSVNPQLLLTRAQVDAFSASVSQATASLLPQIYANAGYTRYEEPNISTPIHQLGVFPPLDDEIYEANLQLSIPIFDGGRRLAKRKIATAGVEESRATNDLMRNNILRQVAELFLLARQTADQSQLIYKRLISLYQQLEDLRVLEQGGRVSKGDIALVASLIASTKSDSSAIARSKNRLATRLGFLVGAKQAVLPALPENDLAGDDLLREYPRNGLIQAEFSAPTVRISEARLGKAKAFRSLAARNFWPEISGYGMYLYRSGSDWDPVGEWAIGVKVSLPIFTGGSRIGKIKETAALTRASKMAVRSAELEQESNLRLSYNDYLSALDQSDQLSIAVKKKAVSVEVQNELFNAGRIPLRDLHTQETELLRLQIENNAKLYSARLALLRYEALTGTLSKSKALMLIGGIE